MRKLTVIAITSIFCLGTLYLVSSGNAKPIAPALKITVLVSDSGPLSFTGPIQRAAVRLAVKDLATEKSNMKLETTFIDVGDSESENQRALSRLQAFDPDLVIAPIESESTKALIQMNEKNPVPLIAPSALEDDLDNSSSKPWLFRLATSPSQDSYSLGEFIAKTKPRSTLIVTSSQEQSRSQMKSLAFGMTMNGQRVQTANIKDLKSIVKTKPDALVLISMEESLAFFSAMDDWVSQIPQVYLVPSNLADYSVYPWASALKGAQALSPRVEVLPTFRSEMANSLGNQAILGPRGAAVLALGQRTYDAVKMAVEARSKANNDSSEELRGAISKAQIGGKAVFNKYGFFDQGEYSVFRYKSSGSFAWSSSFSPN